MAASFPPHDAVLLQALRSDAASLCLKVVRGHCMPVTDFIPAPPVSLAIPPKANVQASVHFARNLIAAAL